MNQDFDPRPDCDVPPPTTPNLVSPKPDAAPQSLGAPNEHIDKEEAKKAVTAELNRHLKSCGFRRLTKTGLLDRLGRHLAWAGYRYVGDEKTWLEWQTSDGCFSAVPLTRLIGFTLRWVLDKPLEKEFEEIAKTFPWKDSKLAMSIVKEIYNGAEESLGNDLSWLNSALKHVCGHPLVCTKSADYDANPEILNCRNGFINLRTLEFVPHEPNHGLLFRQCIACNYVPEAECPRWMQYLRESQPEDAARPPEDQLILFLQYIAGTAIIGWTAPHRSGFWVYGPSTTGKSVFANTLYKILGTYACVLDTSLLMRSGREGRMANTLASIAGKRLLCINEVPDGHIDDTKFKMLTSRDPVAVRELYEKGKNVEFTHTFLATTNHQPVINDTGGAVFNRLRTIPFTTKVSVPDPNLEDKLMGEASGILNWVVRSAHETIMTPERYLRPPAIVQQGVEEYRAEMNIIGNFMEECCDKADEHRITSTDSLFDVFKLWAERNNQMAKISRTRFTSMMKEVGHEFGRYGPRAARIIGLKGVMINDKYTRLLQKRGHMDVETGTDGEGYRPPGFSYARPMVGPLLCSPPPPSPFGPPVPPPTDAGNAGSQQ